MSLETIRRVAGDAAKIARIKAPKNSFEDWKRFLDECERAGLVAYQTDGGTIVRAELFGLALHRRHAWLRDSIAAGIPFEQAEQLWNASIERDRAAMRGSSRDEDRRRAQAMRERNTGSAQRSKRRNSGSNAYQPDENDDDVLDYATGVGL